MSLFDDASLVLIPDGAKDGTLYSVKPTDGTGDFTFTRGSNLAATRVDENGLIEKGRENLLLNSIWDGVGPNTAPTNFTITSFASGSFDAGSQANSIRFTSPTTADRIMITQAPSITGVIVGSVYVEEIHSGSLNVSDVIARVSGTSSIIAYLENGVVVDAVDPVSAGNTYAVVVDVTSAVTFRFGVGTSGPTAADVTLSKPQVEYGLVNTDYIETGATTAQAGILEDLPRIDYSGGASCPALLLEPQRSNLIVQSEYLNTWWGRTATSVTDNATTSPEGVLNGAKIVESATTASHLISRLSITISSGTSYTLSAFAKAGGRNVFRLFYDDGVGSGYSFFNLSTGAKGTESGATGDIEDYGNGWYRCSITFTSASTSTYIQVLLAEDDETTNYAGNGTDGIFLYGAQFEAGSYPTSYIPTYGSSVTRSVDSCVKTGISSLIGQTEGTLFAEFEIGVDNAHFFLYTNTSNAIYIQTRIGDSWRAYVINGGVYEVAIVSGSVPTSGFVKMAFAYKENDFALYANGSLIEADTSGSVPVCDSYDLGLGPYGAGFAAKRTKQTILFPTRLSNTELAALTTI